MRNTVQKQSIHQALPPVFEANSSFFGEAPLLRSSVSVNVGHDVSCCKYLLSNRALDDEDPRVNLPIEERLALSQFVGVDSKALPPRQ